MKSISAFDVQRMFHNGDRVGRGAKGCRVEARGFQNGDNVERVAP